MKFSRMFLTFCTLAAVSGCAYIIPPEENAPRNNTVLGEPHRPELNNSSMTGSTGQPHSANTHAHAPAQDTVRNDAPMLPPVDEATKAQAQQQMAQAPEAAIVQAPVPAPVVSARHVPVENQQFEVSANDSYPSLMNVPERPALSGPGSAKDSLTNVQSDLVQERTNAANAKDALTRDAGAEPSMLAPMPQTSVVPPSDPIAAAPMPAPAPTASVTVPPRDQVRKVPAQQPGASAAPVALTPLPQQQAKASYIAAVPNFAPPAPMSAAATPIAPAPAHLAPITLMPPAGASDIATQELAAPAPAPAPIITATATRPNVKKGDFDPLAAADNAPIASATSTTTVSSAAPTTYASQGYLSASRYAAVRRY